MFLRILFFHECSSNISPKIIYLYFVLLKIFFFKERKTKIYDTQPLLGLTYPDRTARNVSPGWTVSCIAASRCRP